MCERREVNQTKGCGALPAGRRRRYEIGRTHCRHSVAEGVQIKAVARSAVLDINEFVSLLTISSSEASYLTVVAAASHRALRERGVQIRSG